MADIAYLQHVRAFAQAEAERMDAEVDTYRLQQRAVDRQLAGLIAPAAPRTVRRLGQSEAGRAIVAADSAQRDNSYTLLQVLSSCPRIAKGAVTQGR